MFDEGEVELDGRAWRTARRTREVEAGHVPHPYTAWDTNTGLDSLAEDLRHFESGDAARTFDLLVVGSSVAAGFGYHGAPRVARALKESGLFGASIRILRYGRGAFKQPQQLLLVAYLFSLGFEPDAVLCIDGFNEVLLGLDNAEGGTHPSYPDRGRWTSLVQGDLADPETFRLFREVVDHRDAAKRVADGVERWGLSHSYLLGRLSAWRFHRERAAWLDARERFVAHVGDGAVGKWMSGPPLEGGEATALGSSIAIWERATRDLHSLCAGRSIPFFHVLQPNPAVSGSKPLSADERVFLAASPRWVHAAEIGYPLLFEASERLRGLGVDMIDGTRTFALVDATVYRDAGHLSKEGERRFADFLAKELIGRSSACGWARDGAR